MLILPGSLALSLFRQNRLLRELQALVPAVSAVHGRFLHLVDGVVEGEERTRLEALLEYGDAFNGSDKGELFLVVPRFGTISPWSTKATDIAHNCAMTQVQRIERGIRYRIGRKAGLFGFGAAPAPAPDMLERLADALHDRMTESWFAEAPDPAQLFMPLQGKPLARIPLRAQGREALLAAR